MAASPAELLLVTAATTAGLLERPARRVLVVAAGRDGGSPSTLRRLAARLGGFDAVVVPAHPGDAPAAVTAAAGYEDLALAVPDLVVGAGASRTGRSVARRWADAPVTLLASGTTVYGPTPEALEGRLAGRVGIVLHLDLAPGVPPLLLSERGTPSASVPADAHRAAVALLPAPGPLVRPTTVVLGRRAAWAGALDAQEGDDLLVAVVERCAEAGHSRLLLLLDPDAAPRTRRLLTKAARAARADLRVVEDPGPTDPWFALEGTGLVVGTAAEDLLVAREVFGCRVAQLDTERVLKHLEPYADPRRPGATLVGATVPDLRSWTSSPEGEAPERLDLPSLMTTVGYAMDPELLAAGRGDAIAFLEAHPDQRGRFVRKRRLSALRLPGGKRPVRAVLG